MIGILLISHGTIASAFLEVAGEIIGEPENVRAVCLPMTVDGEEVFEELQKARKSLDRGEGVLILTDMFGGTPCNLSLAFLEEEQVEVLTGMNLPMILKILSAREGTALEDLARMAKECGRENIYLAREILEERTEKN